MSNKLRLCLLSCLFSALLSFIFELSVYEVLAFGFTLFAFLNVVYEFGRSIAIRELMGFIATLQLLFSSAFELIFQPEEMPITSDTYFAYALPAVIVYYIGLVVPFAKQQQDHVALIGQVKAYLTGKERVSTILLVIGVLGTLSYQYLPLELKAVVNLFAICLYAAVMYGHYLSGRTRQLTLLVAFTILVYSTVKEGAFGHLIFWTTLYLIVVSAGTQWGKNMRLKLAFISLAIVFVVVIQSVKLEYRLSTWGDKITDRRADPELMLNLIKQRLADPDFLLSRDHILNVVHRFNQGGLLALTMTYVPRAEPFAEGEILLHFLYPVVPRIVWANKPITGGMANITRFTPLVHTGLSSSNISPFGEAYANFGENGGIVFIFFFGLLLNLCFTYLLKIAEIKPSILLWLPCFFSGCLTIETDILSIWGSFLNVAVFLFLFWRIMKRFNVNL